MPAELREAIPKEFVPRLRILTRAGRLNCFATWEIVAKHCLLTGCSRGETIFR